MVAPCSLMDNSLAKLELQDLTDFMPDQVRWQDNKPSVKQMTQISISKSLREFFANTYSSHSLLIEVKSSSFRTHSP